MSSGSRTAVAAGAMPPDDTVRVEVADGYVVFARPFSPRDYVVVRDTVDVADWFEYVDKLVVDHSFGKPFLDWPIGRTRKLMTLWRERSEEDALPPAQGESSPQP